MENKQTAVRWLEENLIGNPHFESDFIHNRNTFKQAKAMEKEQMIKFADKVLDNAECSFTGTPYLEKDINEIYKDTYEQ